MDSLILRKLPKFSQFIRRFKVGIFWVLVLGCTSKFFPINKEILGFLNIAPARLLIFSNSWKRRKIELFEYKPRLHFQIFPNSLKSWEIGIFEVPSISFYWIVRIVFQAQYVCRGERGPNLWLNCHFSGKFLFHISKTILCQFKYWNYCFQA